MMKCLGLLTIVGLVVGMISLAGCKKNEPKPAPPQDQQNKQPPQRADKPAPPPPPAAGLDHESHEKPMPPAPPAEGPGADKPAPPAPPAPPTPPAAEDAKQPTPWAKAKPGTMVKYRLVNNMTQTMEVTKVDDDFVYANVTVTIAGNNISVREQKMPRFSHGQQQAVMPPGSERKELGEENVELAGKTYKCKVIEVKMKSDDKTITSKSWTCADIPGGTVKSESDMMSEPGKMQVTMQLVDYKE